MKKKNVTRLPGEYKSIQIHPSRLCNLSCLHCYSSSSPKERGALSISLLSDALSAATDDGYNYVSLSGGEPLLYKPLEQLLRHAKKNGYKTAITTNGMLLDKNRVETLEEVTDLVAVSLDGMPESHNKIRGSDIAFEKMFANIEHLQNSTIPFGFIFTLTQYNLHELEWVVNFALEHGAKLLQIHPLENEGSAIQHLNGEFPDRKESAYAYLYAQMIRQNLKGKMDIQIDYATKAIIQQNPNLVYVRESKPNSQELMADCLNRIAIEPDGTIVPIEYGFSRKYALGNLHKTGFKQMADEWKQNKMAHFYNLCEQVYQEITSASKPFVFNWNEIIGKASNQEIEIDFPIRNGTSN